MSKIGGAVSRAWGVEQSAVDNTPKVSYVKGGELTMENHGGIEGIADKEIKFGNGIEIHGERLMIEWIEKDYAVVKGKIECISIGDSGHLKK